MPILSSVLGTLLGGVGSLAPAVIDMIDKRNERSHIEKIKAIEVEAAKIGAEFTFKGIEVSADTAEQTALLAHDTSIGAENKLVKALRESIRPVITYAFFGLFLVVKLTALYVAFGVQSVPLAPALIALWDEDTAAIFAAVIAFWFGSRAIQKFGYGGGLGSKSASPLIAAKTSIKK